MPEVSVIVPNYNYATFLEQRLNSILNQSFQDFELIILDDCSTDGSRDVIDRYRSHPKVSHIVINDVNSGSPFIQWKKGISLCTGKYLWIAESDDFADTNFLSVAISHLKLTGSQLFYSKTIQVDREGKFLRTLDWWYTDLDLSKWEMNYSISADVEIRKYLVVKNILCNASAVVFTRNERLMGYLQKVQSFKFCGDWLFWLQYLKNSHGVCYSVQTTNYWRDHANSTRSYISFSRNIEMLKVYRWIVVHILHREDFSLLKYYYKFHIHKKPRKNLLNHLGFAIRGFRFAKYLPFMVMKFYIAPKQLEVENSLH